MTTSSSRIADSIHSPKAADFDSWQWPGMPGHQRTRSMCCNPPNRPSSNPLIGASFVPDKPGPSPATRGASAVTLFEPKWDILPDVGSYQSVTTFEPSFVRSSIDSRHPPCPSISNLRRRLPMFSRCTNLKTEFIQGKPSLPAILNFRNRLKVRITH